MFESLDEAIKLGEGKNNDGGVPTFYKKAVPVRKGEDLDYEDEVWVKIFNKGDPKSIMERPKRPEDETRWPNHWKAYLENQEPDIDGIPLDDFPKISPAERMRCKSLHLMSVEDLANYPDGQIKDLGGRGHTLKKAAREWLAAMDTERVNKLESENESLKARLEKLEKQLGDSTGNSGSGNSRNKSAKSSNTGNRKRANRKNKATDNDSGKEAGA